MCESHERNDNIRDFSGWELDQLIIVQRYIWLLTHTPGLHGLGEIFALAFQFWNLSWMWYNVLNAEPNGELFDIFMLLVIFYFLLKD